MQAGAYSVTIATVANQPESNPIAGWARIMKHDGRLVQARHDCIDTAISVEIAKGHATMKSLAIEEDWFKVPGA